MPIKYPLLLIVAGVAALWIDPTVAAWCAAGHLPHELGRILNTMEPFGNGYGVLLVAWAVWLLDSPTRRGLPMFLMASLGSGLVADALKLLVARYRPRAGVAVASVWESFHSVLPGVSLSSHFESFPSAHSATAVGLAYILTRLYPQGRPLFVVLAVGVCCQRVNVGAHYPSDALVGAAIGWFVAGVAARFLPNAKP